MKTARLRTDKLKHTSLDRSLSKSNLICRTFSTPESNEVSNEFYFESDHLALKDNKEYLNLLKTVATLEAQRHQAVCDVDKIVSLQKKAMEDPLAFAENVLNGSLEIPAPQVLCDVPDVEWSKFSCYFPEGNRPLTRKSLFGESNEFKRESCDSDKNRVLVRGRIYDQSKPETFNQLWTVEEQRRLEHLLVEHPPEEVETNRWRKIAAALGNRTAKQVCSRVQKYFLKLHKAGLPVPGRLPKSHYHESSRRSHHHNHVKKNRLMFRPTTFFPAFDVPVHMNENDTDFDLPILGPSPNMNIPYSDTRMVFNTSVQHVSRIGHEIDEKLQCWKGYQKVEILKAVLQEKESGQYINVRHRGFKCTVCNEEPISGVRWHCVDCKSSSIDFCSDCVVRQLDSSAGHPFSHILSCVKIAHHSKAGLNELHDEDYLYQSFTAPGNSVYNYLDPNFMPA